MAKDRRSSLTSGQGRRARHIKVTLKKASQPLDLLRRLQAPSQGAQKRLHLRHLMLEHQHVEGKLHQKGPLGPFSIV